MTSTKMLVFDNHNLPNEYQLLVSCFLESAFGVDEETELKPEPHTKIIAIDCENNVIGHLAAYVRDVDFETGSMPLGMIGDVATSPAFQRKGVAKKMVRTAHDLFLSLGINFSILFAYNQSVYLSSGYQVLSNEVFFLDEDRNWKTFVYRGSMYCELTDKPLPSGLIDLKGRAV